MTKTIKFKGYKPSELFERFGSNWAYELKLCSLPKIYNKKVITDFNDFDPDTKSKFILIAKNIKKNNDKEFDVWAIGSRIHGCWRTKEEAELLAQQYNRSTPKYSDYDFTTNAEIIPDFSHFNFHCHYIQGSNMMLRKILIPRKEYH